MVATAGATCPRRRGSTRSAIASSPWSTVARAYIVGNHYSGTYPAAVHRYGLWEGARLVGVAVLGIPTSAATLTNLFPDLAP